MNSSDDTLPCADKLAFDTQKAANAAAVQAEATYGTRLKSYECVHCGLWHLASYHG